MKKIYHLGTCDTCRKIIKSLPSVDGVVLHDIKKQPMTEAEVDHLKDLTGSYEPLFSRKATLYKERGLKDQQLSEDDIKKLIMEHYTFLSRPVFIIENQIYIGNSQQNILKVTKALQK